MQIKDKIVSWYIQNVLMPRTEVIDNPGFVIARVSGKGSETYLRELFLPERIFVELENTICNKFAKKGEQLLYSVGKKFGYEYSSLSDFSTIENTKKKDLVTFGKYLLMYVGGTYASNIKSKVDIEGKILELKMKNYIICSKNGHGHIMSEGGIAGIWDYIIHDKRVEGVQLECQGRGDRECKVLCAPTDVLNKRGVRYYTENQLSDTKLTQEYLTINKVSKTSYAQQSLKDLIGSGFFKYSKGIVQRTDERHFLCESSMVYILEEEVRKVKGGHKIVFDIAFDFGKSLAEKENLDGDLSYITDYMSALGWGDVLVLKKGKRCEVLVKYFPWTEYLEKSKFVLFRGILSGLVSGALGREIRFSNTEITLTDDGLNVFMS